MVVRDAPADPYAQVAENQKRHGLTPLDLARFIRAGSTQASRTPTIAKRLGMDLTTVAHHLALLDLPPELDEALKSGRCTSPRTLHELSKLHEAQPEQVEALVAGDAEITRAAVASSRPSAPRSRRSPRPPGTTDRCSRMPTRPATGSNVRLARIDRPPPCTVALPELVALRIRVGDLTQSAGCGGRTVRPQAPTHR